jgi:hypothetical protein
MIAQNGAAFIKVRRLRQRKLRNALPVPRRRAGGNHHLVHRRPVGRRIGFFKERGHKVYTPDVEAFSTRVQKAYLESKFAKDWPPGKIDRNNAIK